MGTTTNSRASRRPCGKMDWRIVLCGSMSAYGEMLNARKLLSRSGIPSIVPVAEDDIKERLSDEEFSAFKRQVSYRHLRTIRHPSTFGVLAVNRDKFGMRDYISPNTFAEIAVAFAQSKHIYLYQGLPKMYEDELVAWGAVALHGDFSRLVQEMKGFMRLQAAQLTLF